MPIFKFLFEFVTEQFSLFDNVLYNYFAMAAVGAVSFSIAFEVVGTLYRSRIINGRFIGSLLHWLIRLIVFAALVILISLVIWVIKLIIAVPTWVWFAMLAVFIISLVAYIAKIRTDEH